MIEYFKRNPKILEQLAFLFMAIVFFGLFYFLMKFSRSVIVLLSLIVISIIILISYFIYKNRFARRFLLKCLIFPILFIIIMLSCFVYFNISEGKGENSHHYQVNFNVYILDNSTTLEKFSNDLIIANNIWNNYNISLVLNKSYFIYGLLNDTEKSFLLNVNASNDSECLRYNQLLSKLSNNDTGLEVIVLGASSDYKGRACICGCKSIILENNKELFMDLTGWNLAHEFGHIFGLVDFRNRYNLMCDEFKFIKLSFLNKEQVKSVANITSNLS